MKSEHTPRREPTREQACRVGCIALGRDRTRGHSCLAVDFESPEERLERVRKRTLLVVRQRSTRGWRPSVAAGQIAPDGHFQLHFESGKKKDRRPIHVRSDVLDVATPGLVVAGVEIAPGLPVHRRAQAREESHLLRKELRLGELFEMTEVVKGEFQPIAIGPLGQERHASTPHRLKREHFVRRGHAIEQDDVAFAIRPGDEPGGHGARHPPEALFGDELHRSAPTASVERRRTRALRPARARRALYALNHVRARAFGVLHRLEHRTRFAHRATSTMFPAMLGVEKRGHVTTVILARPEVKNAVDGPTALALADAFRKFEQDDAANVAVLWGAEGTFCAGADLKAFAEGHGNRVAPDGDGPMGPSRMLLKKPVIAAISGHAVAGGLELALWCDLRVAEEDAVLGVFCRRWGVPLIDGGTVRLPRLIGLSRALDLILTGRAVRADEALAIGLVHRVVPKGCAREAAEALAAEIAAFPQTCLRADRMSAYEQHDRALEAALANELRRGLEPLASGEALSGATRFASGAGRHGKP